jgi:hypothetical protein
MQLMGIAAIYPKPRTTVIDKAKYKYPYLLRGISINVKWSGLVGLPSSLKASELCE